MVIRGRFAQAGAAFGGAIGGTVAGIPGAALGAGTGAALAAGIPEVLVAALLSPRGRRTLEFAIRRGRGTIDPLGWAIVGQVVAQEAKQGGRAAKGKINEFFDRGLTAGK